MKFTSILDLIGFATLSIAASLSVRSNNYPVGVMSFKGTLGGHAVQMNGTVQEILGQMKNKFPDFDANKLTATAVAKRDATPNLFARNKLQPPICCPVPGQDWSFCDAATIQDGINYLNNFNGLCGVGPTSCVRISCSYNAAIYLCNDNGFTITPSCKYMASYAGDIIQSCAFYDSQGSGYVCGQEFDTDRYNIIVREDRC